MEHLKILHNYILHALFNLLNEVRRTNYNRELSKARPADIYVPNFFAGQQTALDIGVTSGLRSDILQYSSINNRFATEEYSEFKKNYLQTEIN